MSTPIRYREEVKRKLIHLSSLWIVAALSLLPKSGSVLLFGTLFVLTVLVERAYVLKIPVITPIYRFLFGKMLRDEPKPTTWIVSGGAPVYAAAALCALCFQPFEAVAGMAVLLTADVAAALIGRRFGRHKLVNAKSLEGSAAFFVTACAVLGIYFFKIGIFDHLRWSIPLAALASTLVELFQKQLRIDDNFTIPITVCLILELAVQLY